MRVLLTVSLLFSGVLTAVVLGGATPASAHQPSVTLYVVPSGSGDCTSLVNACGSIQTAINTAEGGSYNGDDVTINVAAGTYTENDSIDDPSLDSLTIAGAGASSTTVNGGGTGTVFTISGGAPTISGFTITNGVTGIHNLATLTVTDSTVSGNTGGGGIFLQSYQTMTLNDSTVSGNTNDANGGGISIDDANLVVTDSTISGNSAAQDGGGIEAYEGNTTVTDSTLSGNTAEGAYDGQIVNSSATVSLGATILANSMSGTDCAGGSITDEGYNIADDSSCGFSATGSVNNSATLDASLGALANYGGPTQTIFPANTSPAAGVIPTGTTLNSVQVCARTDQRGLASFGNCTIGAVEAEDASLFVAVGESGDCTSLANACGSIQTAINTAEGGSYNGDDVTIDVAAGTYTTTASVDPSSLNSLTIVGAGASSTLLNGNNSGTVLTITGGTVNINGLTIENGLSSSGNADGGGIDSCNGNTGCTVTVTHSTFINNDAAGEGGAIDNGDNGGQGTLTVTDSTFTDNTAYSQGGAIDSCESSSGCTVTVSGSTFTGNSAYYGGSAIYNAGSGYNNNDDAGGQGTLSVTDSTFTDNTGADGGGAIENAEGAGNGGGSSDGALTVTDSTFSGNTASHGGAIDNGDQGGTGSVTVTGSTFSGNQSTNDGGAIDNGDNSDNLGDVGGSVTVSDSTFSNNGADYGGAINNTGTGTNTVTDSTFAGNMATYDGGGIDNADQGGSSTTTVTSSTFSVNWATTDGGAVDNNGSGSLAIGASILSNAPYGGDCSGTVTDLGYNIDDDNSCGFSATGSVSDSGTLDTTLGALKQNAGPTETILPDSDSPAVGAIPNNTTLGATQVCPTTDQQGVASGAGASCNIGAAQTTRTVPTTFAVTFAGTPAAPTVTVWGSGFGTEADLGTPVPAYGAGTGYDYGNQFFLVDSYGYGQGDGPFGDFVGLVISSYSDNQITFTLGSQYANYGPVNQGDTVSVTLLGTTFTGTASYPSHSSAGTPPYAYVANYGAGTVTPISTATGTADTPITVGTHPAAIAVTPNGQTAYVANEGSGTVTPIATATNVRGAAITVGASPDAIGITPNGNTAYVANYGDGTVTPIATATNTAGTPISVGTGPSAIAISPDGQTAYVTLSGSDEVVPIATATNSVGTPISVGDDPVAIAITPDGTTAYVANALDGSVTPLDLTSQTAEPAIIVGEEELTAIAITPDGTTAYVTDNGNSVNPIDLATQTVETYIAVGNDPSAVAVSPDGTTAYVANYSDGTVTPVATATGTAGAPITVGNGPRAVAVMPDQGPAATLAATTAGTTTTFNASSSVPGSSPIVSYAWNFGDGNTATTSTATTTHTYGAGVCAGTMASPACSATVTVTDAVGASTTQVFTGQTVGLNGSGVATASTNVVIATTDCTADNSCAAAVTAPATASAPAQAVTVTVPSGGSAEGSLTVTTGSGQLSCSAKGFKVVASNVTSYSSTFVPSTNVDVQDLITGQRSTKGIKICFEGATPPPAYLKKCARTPVAPCATLAKVTGGVEATILVPGGDPRFRIDGVQTITENPTAIGAKGVIGKTITIKGTDLLGVTSQNRPKVAFTSLGGSTIAGPVTKATATSITVEVPNGAATGAVSIAWPDETMISEGSITIT
jgi:YVTN family beta-propeller protein